VTKFVMFYHSKYSFLLNFDKDTVKFPNLIWLSKNWSFKIFCLFFIFFMTKSNTYTDSMDSVNSGFSLYIFIKMQKKWIEIEIKSIMCKKIVWMDFEFLIFFWILMIKFCRTKLYLRASFALQSIESNGLFA